MDRTRYCIIVAFAASLSVAALGARPEPENKPDPKTRPYAHIDWAPHYAGGTPKVLFVLNGGSAWEAYALARRMDVDMEVFHTNGGRVGVFAPKTDYYHEGIRLYPEAVAELRGLLQREWDAIAFVDCPPYCLPSELHYLVVEKIARGTGAVTFNCGRWQTNWRYPGVKSRGEAALLKTLPLSALSLARIPKGTPKAPGHASGMLLNSIDYRGEPYVLQPLQVREVGKGLVIEVNLGGGNYFGGPAMHPPAHQFPEEMLQNEYLYGLAAKAVYRAAGRAPAVELRGLDADGKTFAPGAPVRVAGRLSAAFRGTVRTVVRNPRNEIVQDEQVTLTGQDALRVELAGLPAGRYYVDVWLMRDKKTVDWASARFTVTDPKAAIARIDLAKTSFAPGERLTGTAGLTAVPGGATLTARVRDAFGRVLVERHGMAIANSRAELGLPLDRTREQRHVLELDLVSGGRTIAAAQKVFYTPRPRDDDLFVYTDGQARNLIGKRRFDLYREHGMTCVETAVDGYPPFLDLPISCGMQTGYRIWMTHCHSITGGCIASPTYPGAVARTFRHMTERLKPYGLKFFSIGDDSGVASDFCPNQPVWLRSYIVKLTGLYKDDMMAFRKAHGIPRIWGTFHYMQRQGTVASVMDIEPTDEERKLLLEAWRENYAGIAAFNRAHGTEFPSFGDIKPEELKKAKPLSPCLLGFRDAMRERYDTVAALNGAWDSKLASFEAITNDVVSSLAGQGKLGAKLDKTWYLEDLFLHNIGAAAAGVRAVSPEVGIGMGAASIGNIIPEVLAHIDSVMPYKGDRDIEIIRSVPHRYCGQTIGVYGGKKVPRSARVNQAWETVLTGGNFIWFWSMCTGGLEGDLSINPGRSGYMLEAIREMQSGIARALIRAKRQHDGIAIFHGRRAGALSGFRKELGTQSSSQVGFQHIIEDLGLQYRYTWTQEIEAGVLRSGEFRVLILPYTQILSEKTAAEIEAFVANGGLLLADLRPATHDWHGRPLPAGRLDKLFGITQSCATAAPLKAAMTWRGVAGKTLAVPGIRGDASVKSAGAEPTAMLGKTPAVLTQGQRKGRTLLLNHSPTTYNILLNRGAADELRALYRSIFAGAGAERRFVVQYADGRDVSGAELALFRNGPVEYLTLEKKSYEFERYPIEGRILLDRKYDVIDVRAGKRLGRTDRIPVGLTGLGCYVYALLPYRVGELRVSLPASVRRGGAAAVKVALAAQGAPPGPHTLRVDVYRPDGTRLWPMYKLEARDGKARVSLPIAHNETPGAWRVTVTDVTTAQSVRQTLEVAK